MGARRSMPDTSAPNAGARRFTVMRVAVYHNLGFSPSEIAVKYGHLTLAQVHAALAYYFGNKDEIDSDISAEETEGAALESQFAAQSARPLA